MRLKEPSRSHSYYLSSYYTYCIFDSASHMYFFTTILLLTYKYTGRKEKKNNHRMKKNGAVKVGFQIIQSREEVELRPE